MTRKEFFKCFAGVAVAAVAAPLVLKKEEDARITGRNLHLDPGRVPPIDLTPKGAMIP
jgi:hypothetical protein